MNTSVTPSNELAASYLELQEFLTHKSDQTLLMMINGGSEDAKKTPSNLITKSLLSNDGVFYTADIFKRALHTSFGVTSKDVSIYWAGDSNASTYKDSPFVNKPLLEVLNVKSSLSAADSANVTRIKSQIAQINASARGLIIDNYLTYFSFDRATNTFTFAAATSGSLSDPAVSISFEDARVIPDPDAISAPFDAAYRLGDRLSIGSFAGAPTSLSNDAAKRSQAKKFQKDILQKLVDKKQKVAELNSVPGVATISTNGAAYNQKINLNSDLPNVITNPHVSLYKYKTGFVSLETSSSDFCDVFFNAIDNVNLSLCVPFIKINIIDRLSKSRRTASPLSLVSFLKKTANEDLDARLFTESQPVLLDTHDFVNQKLSSGKVVGMDVFLSPNLLLPDPTEDIFNPRRLNPSVPLMTLQSFNVSVESAGVALLSRKKGEISIVVHDRSRLGDVRSLFSLGDFSSLYFEIEWGWIHPHAAPEFNNPVARYLNSLRIREIYSPVSYNMSMGDGGVITATISMIAGGYVDSTNTSVTTSNYVPRSLASRFVGEYLKNVTQLQPEFLATEAARAELKPITEVSEGDDVVGGLIDRKFIEDIYKHIKSQPDVFDAKQETTFLKGLLTTINDSQPYKKSDLMRSVEERVRASNVAEFAEATFSEINGKYGGDRTQFASVANILTQFVAMPLASTGLYSEVQIHTFLFNGQAGNMKDKPISDACILIEDFVGKKKDSTSLYNNDSVTNALARLCNALSNPNALCYGIAPLPTSTQKTGEVRADGQTAPSPATAASVAGTPNFTIPVVKSDIRTVPARVFGSESSTKPIESAADPSLPVLQIIVYDSNYLVDPGAVPNAYRLLEKSNALKGTASAGKRTSTGTSKLSVDDAKLINKIAYPNITYGALNSVLKNVSISTNARNALSTYATLQAAKEIYDSQIKSLTSSEIRQIQLIPGSVTATIYGLPIIERGQVIYLDLGTGTSLDDVYRITAVRHNFSGMDYSTDLTLQFQGQGSLINTENIIEEYLRNITPR